jgi:AraC-like DNA-binding protein
MWQINDRSDRRARVPDALARGVVANVEMRGLDVDALLRRSGIEALPSVAGGIPVANYAALEMLTMKALRDESLGYAPRPHKPGSWAVACYAAVHPGDLGRALTRMMRCYALFDRGHSMSLSIEGEVASAPLRIDHEATQQAFGLLRMLSTYHRFACWLLDDYLPLSAVELSIPEPQDKDGIVVAQWMFPQTALLFSQPRTALRFERRWLDKPIQQDDRSLETLLHDAPLKLLQRARAGADWIERLRESLARQLPELPEFEDVARELSMHPQALRRRLAREGLTYTALKDTVRRDAAEFYLRQRTHTIEEVAFRCGFSEASALIRAFKRWNGVTPNAYSESSQPRRESAGTVSAVFAD